MGLGVRVGLVSALCIHASRPVRPDLIPVSSCECAREHLHCMHEGRTGGGREGRKTERKEKEKERDRESVCSILHRGYEPQRKLDGKLS